MVVLPRLGLLPLTALLVVGCTAGLTTTLSPRTGKPAPEIQGIDADGVSFKLSDYRGKVVLLDFWRTD